MPEVKVTTDIAGRVCTIAANVGSTLGEGDDIILVEAMKMEIPVAAPAAGTLKSILIKVDDMIAEGQLVAVIET